MPEHKVQRKYDKILEIDGRIKFRYYFNKELINKWEISPNEWDRKSLEHHNKVLYLLSEIKKMYGIDYELFEFSGYSEERRIYRQHFIPRARDLSRILDERVARALKSRSGYVYVHGVIAIVKDDIIIWFNRGYWRDYERWKTYDSDYPMTIGFLKCILNEPEYLNKLLKEIKTAGTTAKKFVHEELVERFLSEVKVGHIEREVEVGKGLTVYDKSGSPKIVGRYKIDIVWKTGTETFVIEVKEQLNFEAIGQALVYKELYKREHPDENVKSGIVCKTADKELLEIAEKYVDRIWCYEVREKKIRI